MICVGDEGIGGVYHPDYDRKFTVSELKRIMSLPHDFYLTGTFNDKAERIGNMVPPFMSRVIAENIYGLVLSRL